MSLAQANRRKTDAPKSPARATTRRLPNRKDPKPENGVPARITAASAANVVASHFMVSRRLLLPVANASVDSIPHHLQLKVFGHKPQMHFLRTEIWGGLKLVKQFTDTNHVIRRDFEV